MAKKYFSSLAAAAALCSAIAIAAPASAESGDGTNPMPPLEWENPVGVWGGMIGGGNASTYGVGWGNGENVNSGTFGHSNLQFGGGFDGTTCGGSGCDGLKANLWGYGNAGQSSFSNVTSENGSSEGGTVAQVHADLHGDAHVVRDTNGCGMDTCMGNGAGD